MTERQIVALWVLTRLKSDDLPKIAVQWLVEGKDTPALRELAGETRPIMSDVGPLFTRVLTDLNFKLPTRDEALWILAKEYARQILTGEISPYEGAARIWWEVSNDMEKPSELLLSFVGAASEIEDCPQFTEHYEAQIRESAVELLQAEFNQLTSCRKIT